MRRKTKRGKWFAENGIKIFKKKSAEHDFISGPEHALSVAVEAKKDNFIALYMPDLIIRRISVELFYI